MLKIITDRENSELLRVRLYGRFTDEYVPEVEKALSEKGLSTEKIALDLSNVTFVDRAAMKFLCDATSRGVAVENLPAYVSRWIELEERCGATSSYPSEK